MEEKIVTVINEMAEYLNVAQMKKLQEVLLRNFSENEITKETVSNEEYLFLFLDAKKIEGCSERTIQYYRTTIEKLLSNVATSEAYRKYIRKVCVGGIDKRQINLDQVEDFPIILPSVEMQEQFAAFLEQTEKSKVDHLTAPRQNENIIKR